MPNLHETYPRNLVVAPRLDSVRTRGVKLECAVGRCAFWDQRHLLTRMVTTVHQSSDLTSIDNDVYR